MSKHDHPADEHPDLRTDPVSDVTELVRVRNN
jgi:hypothetical protein